jgi:hypothetical protein
LFFFTKPQLNPDGELAPFATLELDRPGRPPIRVDAHVSPDAFSARRDRCDVQIGENTFRGDLHDYDIHVCHDSVTIDIALTAQVPSWRPTSGYLNIREKKEHLQGVGYHDHNWGDVSMTTLINHWYWGRAQAGEYSIVASYIVAEKAYRHAELPIFMLAKRGKIIADDARKVRFHLEDEQMDPNSGKPVAPSWRDSMARTCASPATCNSSASSTARW